MPLITGDTKLNKVKAFIDEIVGKLPADEQAAARAKYSQAQDEVSALAREIDMATATVNGTAQKQQEWYTKHADVIEGRVKTVPVDASGNPIVAAVHDDKLVKDLGTRLDTTRDELAGQGLYLSSVIPTIIAQHGVEFGEVLDGEKLVKDAVAANTDLKTFYSNSVATRRAEKATAKAAADIAAAEARGREAGIKEASNGNIPFPVGNRTPTTLSSLRTTPEQKAAQAGQYTLEAAVGTVNEELAKQR